MEGSKIMEKRKKKVSYLCLFVTFIGFLFFNDCTIFKINNITGKWKISIFNSEMDTFTMYLIFAGDSREGLVYEYNYYGEGTYSVVGDEVIFNFESDTDSVVEYRFNGYFVDKNTMRGTVTYTECVNSDLPSEFHRDWLAERCVVYLSPYDFPSLDDPFNPPI